jgi:hypothetical protein
VLLSGISEKLGIFSAKHRSWFLFDRVSRLAERPTFATFVYQRSGERLLRYFTGSDENEVIWQALKWCEQNSESLTKE